MSDTVLVAGASGALGRHVVAALGAKGQSVRALAREPSRLRALGVAADEVHRGDALDPPSLAGACAGVTRVFSCLGASVQPDPKLGSRTFGDVDVAMNRALIDEARRARVSRFVYVSVFGAAARRDLDYLDAHERVVDMLRESGLDWAVVRPTGFFSAFASFLDLARKGPVPVMGPGTARSNPIDDVDLADVCVDALSGGPRERDVGGPEVLTRNEIAALACTALGKEPRLRHLPLGLVRFGGLLARPWNPRLSHLVAFYAHVTESDLIAPSHGTRRLSRYFADAVGASERA